MTWSKAAFAVSFAVYGGVAIWQAFTLPDRVPLHIGLDGTIDRWGSKTEFLILAIVLALLIFALGPGSGFLMRVLPRDLVNVPYPEYWRTDENWPRAQRLVGDCMWIFGAMMALFLTSSNVGLGAAAVGRAYPVWAFFGGLAAFLLVTALWIVWLYRVFAVPGRTT